MTADFVDFEFIFCQHVKIKDFNVENEQELIISDVDTHSHGAFDRLDIFESHLFMNVFSIFCTSGHISPLSCPVTSVVSPEHRYSHPSNIR